MKTTTNTTNTTTKTPETAWIPANAWTFTPASVCVNGRELPAEYSLARTGDVYVFAKLGDLPVRMHVGVDMPMYADCLAAAKQAAKAPKASAPAPAKAQDKPAPVQAPAPTQDKPAKAAAPKAAKAPKAPKAAAPAPAKAQDKPAPVQAAPAPAPVAKAWAGTSITGKGWHIAFDTDTQRTRVVFDGAPTDAQKAAVLNAGFFWSAAMGSFNKRLTTKAYRAANELAAALNALA